MFKIFPHRAVASEVMDNFSLDHSDLYKGLKDIAWINRGLGGHQITINGLGQIVYRYQLQSVSEPIHILDVGCGGGDTLNIIRQWGKNQNINIRLTGLDANPNIIQFARDHYSDSNIQWKVGDIEEINLPGQTFDVIICSLLCHHFPNRKLIQLLQRLYRNARYAVLVNDLHRHWVAYGAIWAITRLSRCSPMVKYDAPLSVRRGFTETELKRLFEKADITHYTVRWQWPFRYLALLWSS